jgi:tetratricopeptide (TPR) repeat protein
MPSNLSKYLVLFALLAANFRTLAQKTETNSNEDELFYYGVELHNKKLYGQSLELFEKFLASNSENEIMRHEAQTYYLINHVKLDHTGFDKRLDQHLKESPNSAINNYALFCLGSYYFDRGKHKKSVRYFEDLDISNLPKAYWEEANFKMGYAFFRKKKYDEAKNHLGKVKNSPGEYYVEANYYYGYICYAQKNYDCALDCFNKIEGQGPAIIDLYRAHIFYAKKGYQQALDIALSAKQEKYQREYDLLLGNCYFQLGEYEKAASYFKNIDINDHRLSNEDKYQIGFTQFRAKNYEQAVEAFVQLSGEESAMGQLANYQLGQSFLELNEKKKAFNALGVAKRMNFNAEITEVSHFNYAKLAYEIGSANNAIKSMQDFIKTYPKSTYKNQANSLLAQMFLSTNNYTQAIRVLEEIDNFDSETKKVYQRITYLKGEQMYNDRNYKSAKEHFNKALKFKEDALLTAQSYFWLGEIAFHFNDANGAINSFNRMLNISAAKNSKYYANGYYSLGYAYYTKKEYGKALNYFNQYNKLAKSNSDKRIYADNNLRLGDSYFLKNQYNKALSAYRGVSSKSLPGSDYALYQTGIIYGLQEKYDEKIATLDAISRKYQNSSYLDDALFETAFTYYNDLDNSDKALEYFRRIISRKDSGVYLPKSYVKMALIYHQKGNDKQAIKYIKHVIENYPRSEGYKEALAIGEEIYVNDGRAGDWVDYLRKLPNGNIQISNEDSLVFASAIKKYRMGECDKAIKGFQDYKKRYSPNGYYLIHAHFYEAECQRTSGNMEAAMDNYAFVVNQPPTEFSENAALKLAELYYSNQRLDMALPYYSKLERLANTKDNFVIALVGQMRCNFALANFDAAKKNAVDILPIEDISKDYLIEANMVLGKVQLMDENLLTSLFHFDYVIKEAVDVRAAEAQYYRASIKYQEGKYQESENEIFKLNDDYAPYEYWVIKGFVLLSDVYVAQKDYFQARATLQGILEAYEGDQSILDECKEKLKLIDELEAQNPDDDNTFDE